MKSKYEIRLLKKSDIPALERLRKETYVNPYGFRVNPGFEKWISSDAASLHLGAFEGTQLISSLKMMYLRDAADFKSAIQCAPSKKYRFPMIYTTYATTAWEWRKTGLNLLLRYYFLKLAQHWQCKTSVLEVISKGPRFNLIKNTGYVMYPRKSGWDGIFTSYEPVYTGYLDFTTHFDFCMTESQKILKDVIDKFDFNEDTKKIKKPKTRFDVLQKFVEWEAQ